MNIWPAIDLIDGKCVRLTQGDYEQRTVYADDPVQMAKTFQVEGLQYLHLVDLDGAKSGKPENLEIIQKIIKSTGLIAEVGGGIRHLETVSQYLEIGVNRIILGSAAFKKPHFLQTCLNQFGVESIVLGMDLKGENIAISGWQEDSGIRGTDFLKTYQGKHVLVTDISKDGKLEGPNFKLYEDLRRRFPDFNFIASGGVSHLEDIEKLKDLGIMDVIVGKALYEGRIDLSRTAF